MGIKKTILTKSVFDCGNITQVGIGATFYSNQEKT
jgi:hypothetical protein